MNERLSHPAESRPAPMIDFGEASDIDACLHRQVWHMLTGRQALGFRELRVMDLTVMVPA